MSRQPRDTRERLVTTAHDLLYAEGFHEVGLDRILADAGVTKTTFYNHFDSKEALVLEVLREHDRFWQDSFRRMLRSHGGDRPRDQLLAIPAALEELFRAESPRFNGCLFVNVAVEFPRPHSPPHVLAAGHKAAMEDILRELAGYAGADDAAALAQELALIMEGAYVTRQVSGRDGTADIARRLVRSAVDARIPA